MNKVFYFNITKILSFGYKLCFNGLLEEDFKIKLLEKINQIQNKEFFNNLGENKLLQSMNFANFQTEFNRSHYRKKIVGKSFQTDNSPNKLIQSQVIIHSKYFEDEKDKGSSSEEKNLLNQYKTEIRNNNLNLGRTMNNTPYVKKNTVNNNEAVFQSIKILLSTLNRPYLLEVQNELNKLLGK